MTKRWGATAEEWDLFNSIAADDLLPVVSNPDAPIAGYSTMKTTGKTPSRYNDRGEVMGIARWTERTAHKNEIKAWMHEPDYGICIQTRRVRALDIDVDDPAKARAISRFIREFLDDEEMLMAERYRENSGKTLLAFIMPGKFGKRTVKVDGGMIEFLADGHQFVAAGTHPSGARYQWQIDEGVKFVKIEDDVFEDLWYSLCLEFGIEPPNERGVRDYEYTGKHADETGKFLIENGFAHAEGNDGQLFIECPFADHHSTEPNGTDTAYFPAGTGGYDRGHFVCLHASCNGRKDSEFMDAFGVRQNDFEVVEVTEEEKARERPAWETDKYGQPKPTLYNVRLALERPDICGWNIRYDAFTNNIIFYDKDGSRWQIASDELFVELRMRLETVHNFLPIGRELARDAVLWFAKKRQVDTAVEWLNAQTWDGKKRVETFMSEYMGCEDSEYTRAIAKYLWTGLAGRVLEPGLKADMIVVLKSPEGYRKSSAVEAIAPSNELFTEVDFGEKDADLARKMRGKVVAEIAELRGLKTRAVEGILAFVSRRFEEWVPKYREFSTSFPRRLMFIATTNEDEFLDGVRKHRRWLPVKVEKFADVDKIVRDRKQLWAEAREMFIEGGLRYEEADKLAGDHREDFRVKGVWEDVVARWLGTPDDLDGSCPNDAEYLLTPDIARFAINLDPKNLKRSDEMKIGETMRALGYDNTKVYDKELKKQIRAWTKKDAA